MTRKLLPYEYQLIEALGVTKDEYLDFVAQQHIYEDVKEGSALDVRNEAAGTVALVLAIVGTLFQVAAALLIKPPKPQQQGQTRDDVFGPRFGFNSLQELARYGDPVNLVYTNTNTNPEGGVRVNTSLVWAAIKSFGSSQYAQLLTVLGAGPIGRIDYARTAFGQTPIRDLIAENYWIYFNPNNSGPLTRSNLAFGFGGTPDPTGVNSSARGLYRIAPADPTPGGDGFSHVISPTSSNEFGAYSPVPINVDISVRNGNGDKEFSSDGVTLFSPGSGWGIGATQDRINAIFFGNNKITLRFAYANPQFVSNPGEQAKDRRRALTSYFDSASLFKLGSAIFKVEGISNNTIDQGNMDVTLVCTSFGRGPSIAYSSVRLASSGRDALLRDPAYLYAKKVVQDLLAVDQRPFFGYILNGVLVSIAAIQIGNINNNPAVVPTNAALVRNAQTLLRSGGIYRRIPVQSRFGPSIQYQLIRPFTPGEIREINLFIAYEEAITRTGGISDLFFTKALVKIEVASYETTTPCHIVDFALKARVFRKISGRQRAYGSEQREGYPESDNGTKLRTAMFLVKYKPAGSRDFLYAPGIFVIRRAADTDNYTYFRFDAGTAGPQNAVNWQFELEPLHDTQAEIIALSAFQFGVSPNAVPFYYLENNGAPQVIQLGEGRLIQFVGFTRISNTRRPPLNNSPTQTTEWDMFSNDSDTQLAMSFDNGPEFKIVAVTEQIRDSFNNYTLYGNLSMLGFNLYSGKSVQDLRSLSAFVTQGRRGYILRDGTGPGEQRINNRNWGERDYPYLVLNSDTFPNTAPDIFVDTVLDAQNGIGAYANLNSIDLVSLARAKRFCVKNGFFMDGVMAEPTSWRSFWSSVSGFSLLELAKIGGQDTLIPSVPTNADGSITRTVPITALFNQGNILEGTLKEEFIDYGANTQDLILTVLYRDLERNGVFPRTKSVEIRRTDTRVATAVRETIDASAFVTRRDQAIKIGQLLCNIRRESRRAIEFQTFPTDSAIAPGSYIYVETSNNQWDGIYTGRIEAGGVLNMPVATTLRNAAYNFLTYSGSGGTRSFNNVNVVNGVAAALASRAGDLFVLGAPVRRKRVFRITEISMEEEGETTVRAVEHPCDASGNSLITFGIATQVPGLFTVDSKPA